MPFSQDKFDELQQTVRFALVSTALNDWERNFARDMQAKLDRFGRKTRLSGKQYRQLMKLTNKFARQRQQVDSQKCDQPLPVHSREFSQSYGRRYSWRPTSGSLLAATALSLLLIFKGSERFPEYLDPVVSMTSTTDIIGQVSHVRDGDTIEVSGVAIRFGSLNCAERDTSDGQRATARMRTLVAGQTLTCHLNGRTSYDRRIGSCKLQDGQDLGAILIREGYCPRFW